ncbi:hypothetical protein O0I10_011771 [Lichtheimia ornata]|uniref:Uncharacterized protein n=1 Tax=Lichtheimia ornata TaxID=688661 RepID=A0AAD7XTS4_9FUNG|nr:uncharacterized protein O0I10_011771 [Lichtheimia ornata]KAJ8652566.1 hypothetical protein O0I10_011771 [Lichtheimia ornata]
MKHISGTASIKMQLDSWCVVWKRYLLLVSALHALDIERHHLTCNNNGSLLMQQHAWLRDPKASHWGKLLELMLEIKDYQRRLRPRITVIEDRPQTRLRRISMLGWRFAFT